VLLPENLTPAEQKKLRNKQRKKEVQEAIKKEKLKQEEQLRQPQNKSTKSLDPEVEGPKEKELVPDKLAKVCKCYFRFYLGKIFLNYTVQFDICCK